MARRLIVAVGAVGLTIAAVATPSVGQGTSPVSVVFFDDFSGPAINRAHWNVIVTGRVVNNEQQAYVDSGDTLAIVQGAAADGAENGALAIRPRFSPGFKTADGRSFDFISGRIESRGKVDVTYGTVAARIKLTAGAGLWPAFWLLGAGRWPDTGEIDIMEYVGDKTWVSQAVHGPGYSGNTPIVNRTTMAADADATAWHVYSVDWTATEMVFRIDGEAVYQVTKEMIEKHGRWVFDEPKHVIVNFALGGGYPQGVNRVERPYPGLPESTVEIIKADGAVYLVDWVRVTKG